MRDEAGGNGEAERLRLAVELAQENTGLHADGPGLRINMDPLHKTEIDNHPAVADRVAGIAVASSAYGDEQCQRRPKTGIWLISRDGHDLCPDSVGGVVACQ